MRHGFTALLALLTALAVTACGGDTIALDPVAEAAAKTGESSMRIEMSATMTIPVPGSKPGGFSASGVTDGERSSMSMRMPKLPGVPDLGAIEIRSDGLVVYVRMPFLQQQLPGLEPWIKLDLAEAGEGMGIDMSGLLELSRQSDPTQALDILRSAGEVEEVGRERVRGGETTRYRAEIDLEAYADTLEAEGKDALAASMRMLVELGAELSAIDVWVDEASRVRRMAWKQTIPAAEWAEPMKIALEMELFDFGADVDIELPAEEDVMDLDELRKVGENG